jgi:hypothetical protein
MRGELGIHSSTASMVDAPENEDVPWPRGLRAAIWFGLGACSWIALGSLFYLLWSFII